MKHLLSSITLLFLSTVAFGQVPNTFSSGETISSSKINANFSFLSNAMAGGDVTAMMHCRNVRMIDVENISRTYGEAYTNPTVAYAYCHSTDNSTSFIPRSNICKMRYMNYEDTTGWLCSSYQGMEDKKSLITAQTLLNEKWILSQSIFVYDDNVINVFYKVSSD